MDQNTRSELESLHHTSVPLRDGGEILVLDTGAVIGSESSAMLGALHSRSPGGIRGHLKILSEKGSANFMGKFYVGYGHQSIGDLGEAHVFVEGISMLAAKAIQDFPLYNGQEVSTRYVDFSKQNFIDPVNTEKSKTLLERLRSFYLSGLEELVPVLKERFPKAEEESETIYEKAIKARAFDTMRAFLPAGAATNVAWFGSLRQFRDRLPILRNHPLPEVRDIAEAALKALLAAYPNSFSEKKYEATETYLKATNELYTYHDDSTPADFEVSFDGIRPDRIVEYKEALETRPPKTELPYATRDSGIVEFQFLLDFGSFRDLQRHRAVSMRMPLLTTNHGFNSWYLNELPEGLMLKAEVFLEEYAQEISAFTVSAPELQYFIPMGYQTTVRLSGDLRALVYLIELRAAVTVHPTLRVRAAQMGAELLKRYGKYGLTLHIDPEFDRFDIKRGEHDIVMK